MTACTGPPCPVPTGKVPTYAGSVSSRRVLHETDPLSMEPSVSVSVHTPFCCRPTHSTGSFVPTGPRAVSRALPGVPGVRSRPLPRNFRLVAPLFSVVRVGWAPGREAGSKARRAEKDGVICRRRIFFRDFRSHRLPSCACRFYQRGSGLDPGSGGHVAFVDPGPAVCYRENQAELASIQNKGAAMFRRQAFLDLRAPRPATLLAVLILLASLSPLAALRAEAPAGLFFQRGDSDGSGGSTWRTAFAP